MEDETPSWLLPTPVGAGLGAGSVSFSFCANEYLPKSRCLRTKVSLFAYQSLVVCVSKSRCLRTKVSLFAYQSLGVGVPKSPSLRIASVRPTAFERPPEDGWAPARKPSSGRSTDIRVAKRLIHILHKA